MTAPAVLALIDIAAGEWLSIKTGGGRSDGLTRPAHRSIALCGDCIRDMAGSLFLVPVQSASDLTRYCSAICRHLLAHPMKGAIRVPGRKHGKTRLIRHNPRNPTLARDLLPWLWIGLPEVGMRGFVVGLAVVVFSALAFGQDGGRGVAGYCPYGCGPYVPLVTTPSLSFETVSPSPVGATNATAGLQAGARNSTMETTPANTDSVHTEVIWYSGGGSPAVARAVWLPRVEPMHPEGMHPEMMGMREMRGERGPEKEERARWTYYVGAEQSASAVEASAAARSGKHAVRTYTNADVDRVAAKSEPFTKK